MNKKIQLIERLIDLTNSDQLTWKKYDPSTFSLNPEPTSFFSSPLSFDISSDNSPMVEQSYIAKYQGGFIALLAFHKTFTLNNFVTLVLQPGEDKASQTLASSQSDNAEISSLIKRLYNLVYTFKDYSSLNDYIDDILND